MNELRVGHIEVSDVAEHQEAVFPWVVEFDQMAVGSYRGAIDSVASDNVVVYREKWNRRISVAGQSPAEYCVFGTVVRPDARMHWLGSDIGLTRIGHAQPSSAIDFSTGADEDHVVALIRPERIGEYFGIDVPLEESAGLYHMDCPTFAGRNFTQTLLSIVSDHAVQACDDRIRRQDFETTVLEALSPCLTWSPPSNEGHNRRASAFQRALEYIRAQRQAITVPDLAAEVGVSQRTLQYAFKDALAMSPLQFIRRHHMNGAHRDLRSAGTDSVTVREIAARWGFREPGRFAVEYRRTFGRPPSQTLKSRKKQQAPTLAATAA